MGGFMRVKRVLIGLAAIIVAIIGCVVAAPTASAATPHGCPETDFCFYFNSDFAGAYAAYFYSDGNLDNELFNRLGVHGDPRNGLNVVVKNNAASAFNNWSYYATVYYNSSCNGSFASQTFGQYSGGNFNRTMKNENASFKWPASFGAFADCANRDQF
jgi:peptidase inhibitor family I36